MLEAAKITVDGLVQGVGFRYRSRLVAYKNSLVGYVENLEDDTVEILCEGEKKNIDQFIEEIKMFKKPIIISDIRVQYIKPTGKFKSFKTIMKDHLSEMLEGFSAGALHLDILLEKADMSLNKQDQIITEIHDLNTNTREMLDSRFMRLENEILKIKTKLEIQ